MWQDWGGFIQVKAGQSHATLGIHFPLKWLGDSVYIFIFAMLALPLGIGCGGGHEEKPAVNADAGADAGAGTRTDDTGMESADCTVFNMPLQQAETVASSVVRVSFKLTKDGEPVTGKTEEGFRNSEEGDSISVFEYVQQSGPTVASFQLSSVLVLDMSGPMIESGNLPGSSDSGHMV